jgi:hypothetical protein
LGNGKPSRLRLKSPARTARDVAGCLAAPGSIVTIAIAAIHPSSGTIITVSDRMLSTGNDIVQARDNATIKARKISDHWGVMFSGNGELFHRFVELACHELLVIGETHQLIEVQNVVENIYKRLFDKRFTDIHLSKFGYKNVSEFRRRGLGEFGKDIFGEIINSINNFDLGIEFIIYGYDKQKMAHIFCLENPGLITNHHIARFAVIGSGSYMARASLHRKDLLADINSIIYRLLEAKFSAETASGVGESTTVILLNEDGKNTVLPKATIRKIREIWKREITSPDPIDATTIIAESPSVISILKTKSPPPA